MFLFDVDLLKIIRQKKKKLLKVNELNVLGIFEHIFLLFFVVNLVYYAIRIRYCIAVRIISSMHAAYVKPYVIT